MNRLPALLVPLFLGAVCAAPAAASGLPVKTAHPRLLFDAAANARLLPKKNANDPAWRALKAQADRLAGYAIFPYHYDTRWEEPDNTIFYDYHGEGWFRAAMPLALAYRMTGEAKYANKLLALADEMVRAQADPANLPPRGLPPLQPGNYYPTRYLGPVAALIFDVCHDRLGAARKARMVKLMNAYFDDLRANAYQVNDYPDGNYFPNHMVAAAAMGYATFGDNPRAQAMIDWARMRFDGSPSALVAANNKPSEYVAQAFEGGMKPAIASDYNGPNIKGAPWRGGFNLQGWSYATQTYNALADYLLVVKSATGEDLLKPRLGWFKQMFMALKHSLMPDRFKLLPAGDWGSDWGAVINRSLPVRLAFLLQGTAEGPAAQYFAYSEIPAHSPYPVDFPDYGYQDVGQPMPWESFFFGDAARPAKAASLPPYYSGYNPKDPPASRAIPYFFFRGDWTANATWAFAHLGASWYNDHQHFDAGSFIVTRGRDQLLIDASNWKWAEGFGEGIYGSSFDETAGPASAANTLWFNDFGEFMRPWDAVSGEVQYAGGQGNWGKDEVQAAEQTAAYSYLRANLVSAYNRSGDPADQAGRKLAGFSRALLYLRAADLFVVYDQVRAANSTHRLGQYRKHLRWHFPRKPVLAGNLAQVDHGSSRLYLQTLLPSPAALTVVDETKNADPCDGAQPNCVSYLKADIDITSHTWRIEAKHPANPLAIDFLTLLQTGAKARPAPTGTALDSQDGKMRGAGISQDGGKTWNLVLVNRGAAPLANTSYRFAGPAATHTLGGMAPNKRYRATAANGVLTVKQDAGGPLTASAAGVLQFRR